MSSGGTAVGTVSAGKISFTAGTLWDLKLSNGAIYPCSQGFEAYIYNTGVGANAQITGAILNNFWGSTQDVYHYNIRAGFRLYSDGSGNYIKVPIGKTCETAGYTLESENQASKWHNGAETGVKPPDSLSDIQDLVPITSLTKNANLRWIDGVLDEFSVNISGAGTITEVINGTKFDSAGDFIGISQAVDFKAGDEYKYYVEIVDYISGGIAIDSNSGTNIATTADGIYTGTHSQLVDYGLLNLKRNGTAKMTVKKFYMWKVGTVPPLFYKEFETDFNNAHMVFSNIEDKKKRSILIYSTAQTGASLDKIRKLVGIIIPALDFSNESNSSYIPLI